jgi:hypothetical protein
MSFNKTEQYPLPRGEERVLELVDSLVWSCILSRVCDQAHGKIEFRLRSGLFSTIFDSAVKQARTQVLNQVEVKCRTLKRKSSK